MLTHDQIWLALDALATKHGMSASGLAKAAGLDPTTFNKSKRLTPDGRQRWPSTESVAKVLIATGETLDDFVALVGRPRTVVSQTVPMISLPEASRSGAFDAAGNPVGEAWDELSLPSFEAGQVFALEVTGDGFLPVFRDGDVLLLSLADPVRRGDRVVLRMTTGTIIAGTLRRETARTLEIQPFDQADDAVLDRKQVAGLHRIVWARQ